MLYRTIVTPTETKLTIELPQELVGKSVEVLAFEVREEFPETSRKKSSAEEIKLFYEAYEADMNGYRFNRDEANER